MIFDIIRTAIEAVRAFLAPLLAYLKGRKDVENDQINDQNKALRRNIGLSDRALSDKLRARAKRKGYRGKR